MTFQVSVYNFYHRDKFSLTLTGFLQVYQREELQMIADLCIKHDVICISDEVYEWLTYDGTKHVKIGKSRTVQVMRLITVLWTFKVTYLFFLTASLPGMWERTVTIGSAGKTFSATGWKVSWSNSTGFVSCNVISLCLF